MKQCPPPQVNSKAKPKRGIRRRSPATVPRESGQNNSQTKRPARGGGDTANLKYNMNRHVQTQ